MGRKMHLKTRLIITYVLLAIICVGLIGIITNSLVKQQFQNYVQENITQRNNAYLSRIAHSYEMNMGFNLMDLENIGVLGLEDGVILKIEDLQGNALWDAREHNNGLCEVIIENMSRSVSNAYPFLEGGDYEKAFDIIHNDIKVGVLRVHYYGPFYLNTNDLEFLNTLNLSFLGIGGVVFLLAIFLGLFMANHMIRPIDLVVNQAQNIAKGIYNAPLNVETKDIETDQLIEAMNLLSYQLNMQDKQRNQLTADMAHELRTPLSMLQSHLEAMIDGVWESDAIHLESCLEETLRMGRLVQGLEQIAKIEHSAYHPRLTTFQIAPWLLQIVDLNRLSFLEKNIQLQCQSVEMTIKADKDLLTQALLNLLGNALKYTDCGSVSINCEVAKDQLVMCIQDTGIGIAEEHLPMVFDKFYRVDKSRSRESGGYGIGLSIVKQIIQAHHGNVVIESAPNQGTCVKIILPLT